MPISFFQNPEILHMIHRISLVTIVIVKVLRIFIGLLAKILPTW